METLAWILLLIGAIVGIVAIIAVGILGYGASALYASNPDLKKDITNWVPVIFAVAIPIGLGLLIYFWIHFAYLALQAGNFSMTVLIISIVIIPLLFFGIYYLIPSKEEKEEEKKQAAIGRNVSMARSAIQIVPNEEKNGCLIKIAEGCEYNNVKIYVDVIKTTGKENTKWKKEVALLDKQQAIQLDFTNLPDNQAEEEYYVAEMIGYDTQLLSFKFEKHQGNIESLKTIN